MHSISYRSRWYISRLGLGVVHLVHQKPLSGMGGTGIEMCWEDFVEVMGGGEVMRKEG